MEMIRKMMEEKRQREMREVSAGDSRKRDHDTMNTSTASSTADDDLTEKEMLREILLKMTMLDEKMNVISTEITEIKQSVKDVNEKVERHEKMFVEMRRGMDDSEKELCCVKEAIENVAEDVEFNRKCVSETDRDVDGLKKVMKDLEWKAIDGEARSKRNNMIFWGIQKTVKDGAHETDKSCEVAVREVIRTKLKLDDKRLSIQRVHRLKSAASNNKGTTYVGSSANKPPGIIVFFRDFTDKQEVLRAAKNSSAKVSEDHPFAIRNARASLMAEVKAARSCNPPKQASIAWPAKLVIDSKVVKEVDVVEHARRNRK